MALSSWNLLFIQTLNKCTKLTNLERWSKKEADLNLFEYSVLLNLVSEAQARLLGSTHFPRLQERMPQVNHHLLKVTV
jgi:hypothetical protein